MTESDLFLFTLFAAQARYLGWRHRIYTLFYIQEELAQRHL